MDTAVSRVEAPVDRLARSRRRQYIVNPAFQWRVVLTVSIWVFLCSSIVSTVLYGVLHAQARARLIDPFGYTAEVPLVVIGFGLAFSLMAAIAVGLWCVVITHRICGPLRVMAGWLEELAVGKTPELRPLRKNDEFKDFYQILCRVVESSARRRSQMLEVVSEALSCAESAAAADPQRAAPLDSVVRNLQTLRDTLRQGA